MAVGRTLGQAWVNVSPDASTFRPKLLAEVKAAIAGINPTVPVSLEVNDKGQLKSALGQYMSKAASAAIIKANLDAQDAYKAITALRAQLTVLSDTLASIPVGVDDRSALATIADLQLKLAALAERVAKIKVGADPASLLKAQAQILAFAALVEKNEIMLRARVDDADVLRTIASLRERISEISANLGSIRIGADDAQAQAIIDKLQAELLALSRRVFQLKVGVDTREIDRAREDILNLMAQVERAAVLGTGGTGAGAGGGAGPPRPPNGGGGPGPPIPIPIGGGGSGGSGAAATAASVSILTLALSKLSSALANLNANISPTLNAFASWNAAFKAAGGWVGVLATQVPLFGGALDSVLPRMLTHVSVLHITADALVELIAVWGGAAIAAGAFAFAASDAVNNIKTRLTDLHTVQDATATSTTALGGSLESLHKAVTPSVYQLFGDALNIISGNAGGLSKLVLGAATAIDQLAGRMTAALTSGGTFNTFTKNAVTSLSGLGTAFGNVFGAIGYVLKVLPDYAQKLLAFGVAVTGVLEAVVRTIQPVIGWGLAIHGAFIYIGLAVTAAVALIGPVVKLGGLIIGMVTPIIDFGAALIAAAKAGDLATFALTALGEIPIAVWVGLAAAAITALILIFRSGSSAAQQFNDSVSKSVAAASLAQTTNVLGKEIQATTQQMNLAQAQADSYARAIANAGDQTVTAGRAGTIASAQLTALRQDYLHATQNVQAYKDELQKLTTQQGTFSGHLADIAKITGSTSSAMGALTAAGITQNQMLDTNAQDWAATKAQVEGTIAGYKEMTGTAGQLNNDLDVLGRTATDQYQAIQKLNQGWSSFISDVTGTQSTFDTLALGMQTLDQNFQQAGGSGEKLRNTLGKLSLTGTLTGASMDGLNQASLDLNQAFTGQVSNVNNLLASLRTAGISNDVFTQAVKDAIIPLVKYASGSQEATAQLVALAQEANYTGPVSIQALTNWLGAAAVKSDQFTSSVKGLLQPMVTAAASAKTVSGNLATLAGQAGYTGGKSIADLVSWMVNLAKQAGYTGDGSLKSLTSWLQQGSKATQGLKDITNAATTQAALLTGAMQSQGDLIKNQLIGDINQAILKYEHVTQDAANYGTALAQSGGVMTGAVHKAQQTLINDLINAGNAAHETTGQIAAMIAQVLQIPLSKAIQIVLETSGKGQIIITGTGINTRTINTTSGQVSTVGGHTVGPAKGWLVSQGTTPTADDVLVKVSRGELIVPASMVKAGAVDHLRGSIPGFAAGGVAGGSIPGYAAGGVAGGSIPGYAAGGPVGAITNAVAQVSQAHAQWGQQVAVDFATAAAKAAQAAAAAAASALGGSLNLGPGSGSTAQAYAQSLLPAGWSWPALVALWNQESGWNPFAVNASSGAYGIPQALPAVWDHPYALGDYQSQIRWGLNYIAGRYGSSQAAEAHELAMGWYDRGGVLSPWGFGVNTSGKPEMVTPASGSGSLAETNMRLDQLGRKLDKLIGVTATAGASAARGLSSATGHGALRGYYGG